MDEQNVVERYVLGQLPDAERDRLEEHYLECAECLEKVRAAEGLKRGLSGVAGEYAHRGDSASAAPPARPASARRGWWGVAAAAILLLGANNAFLWWRLGRAERELERAMTVAADLERNTEAPGAADGRMSSSPTPLIHRWEINRGDRRRLQLKLPAERRWIVLLIDLPRTPSVESFKATITSAGSGDPKWQQQGLRLESDEGLAVAFPSDILTQGDYALTVEALLAGQYSRWAEFQFRAAN